MNIDYDRLPYHMQHGARMYIENGVKPGSFLTSVLSNNFYEAYKNADDANVAAMKEWAIFLNNIPISAWGSKEIVEKWRAKKGLNGISQSNEVSK